MSPVVYIAPAPSVAVFCINCAPDIFIVFELYSAPPDSAVFDTKLPPVMFSVPSLNATPP